MLSFCHCTEDEMLPLGNWLWSVHSNNRPARPPEAQLPGSREKTLDILEERWQKEAVVALTPWEASLSMPQGQGSLLGHHTLSISACASALPPVQVPRAGAQCPPGPDTALVSP